MSSKTEEKSENLNPVTLFSYLEKPLLIGSLPFAGYFLGFNFLKGYLSFFDIPVIFAKVGIENIIIACFALFLSIMSSLLFLNLGYVHSYNNSRSKLRADFYFSTWILLLLLLGFDFYLYSLSNASPLVIITFTILIVLSYGFIFAVVPLIRYPWQGSLSKTYFKYYEKITEVDHIRRPNLLNKIFDKGKGYFLYILFIFFLSFMANTLGTAWAKSKESFLFYNFQGKEYLVVGNLDENLITISYDPVNKITTNNIVLIPLSSPLQIDNVITGEINRHPRKGILDFKLQ